MSQEALGIMLQGRVMRFQSQCRLFSSDVSPQRPYPAIIRKHGKAASSVEVEGQWAMSDFIQANRELVGIIERNYESKSLDYKGPLGWDSKDKKSCCELVKDIIAVANTEGGYIVIGVAEKDEGFELVGVSAEQAGTYESTALCQFLQRYSDPPINVQIKKASHKGKSFVVLEIPRFKDTPHIC